MAYEGGYQTQQRPYPGSQQPQQQQQQQQPRPYPPQQPRYDDYQGDPGYDYYDDGSGYGPEYSEQYQDPGYARGPPPDQRYPPQPRPGYHGPPQPNGAGRGGLHPVDGGRIPPLQRAQTMDPMRSGPHPTRGGLPPGPGRGYPGGPPGRDGGYGGGPPPNMDPRMQGRPPMNGSMRGPASGRPPQQYPPRDQRGGGYDADAQLSNKMAGMDISQRPGMAMSRHSGGSQRSDMQSHDGGYGPQLADAMGGAPPIRGPVQGYEDSRQGPEPTGHPGYGAANQHDQGYGPGGHGPGQDSRPAHHPQAGPGGDYGPPSRSMTMPMNAPMAQRQPVNHPPRMQSAQQGPGPNRGMQPPQRPATSHSSRPPPQRFYPSNNQGQPPLPGGYGGPPGPPQPGPPQSRASYDDILDIYGDSTQFSNGPEYNGMPPPAPNNDMPNFDNLPQQARSSLDLHLSSGNPVGNGPVASRPLSDRAYDMHRAKSQPDLRGSQNAVYEMAGDAPPMPSLPPGGQFGRGGPGQPMPMRGPSASGLPGHPGPRGSNGTMTGNPFPPQSLDNPDALPSHPTPVRPGLMADSVVNVASKPPPVRMYNNQSPVPMIQGSTGPPPSTAPSGPAEDPVTADEIERLRMMFKADVNDHELGLKFAKRLVEASEVLVPNLPDPRAKQRVRDKYLADAHKVLKKVATGSNKDAMFFLADCLGRGLFGNEPDNKEAFTLYQSAAKLGHAAAAYRTAVCCEIGHEEGGGTRRDPLKATQWYKRSATLGDTPAMYKMGMIQLKGLLGQPKNPREAIGWLKRAADQADAENPHALHELGLLYESASPEDVIIRDEAYALSLFRRAAEMGYKFSQFRLGCAYEYGLMGCPIDPRLSIMWYSKAAVQQEHQAELALSGWYLTGSEGVLSQSDTEAYLWARKAATAGLAKAEYAMGYFTEVGIGVAANMDDAKRWYWRAAAQDLLKARERLEDLKRAGKSGPRQRERISRSKMQKQQEGECSVM